MTYQYYYKRLYLYNLAFKNLINFQAYIGNSLKLWTSYHMNEFILGIRNDLYILDIQFTIIQIRKALNAIYHRIRYGSPY